MICSCGHQPLQKRHKKALSSLLPCEDTSRRWLSTNQEENCHKNLNLLAPWPWTSQPPVLWQMNVCLYKSLILWYFFTAAQTDWQDCGSLWGVLSHFLIHSLWGQQAAKLQAVLWRGSHDKELSTILDNSSHGPEVLSSGAMKICLLPISTWVRLEATPPQDSHVTIAAALWEPFTS